MKPDPNKIVIHAQTGSIFVNINEIIYCQGAGSYTELTLTKERKIISSNLLKQFEQLLVKPDGRFFRLHRSFLVNIDYILEYRNCSRKRIILAGPVEIPIAHRKSKEFLDMLEGNFLHLS